ncbi:MAG: hypothetical protein ABH851_09500 [Methanobacteriota archaeon]
MAKGFKNKFTNQTRKPKHNWRNKGGDRKKMLDMRRSKYFGFELKDLLTEFELGEKQGVIGATLTNNATVKSIDSALEYIKRLEEDETFSEKQAEKLRKLISKYSKWR